MSYILDALKKSERARGSRKTRSLIEEPVKVTLVASSPPHESTLRWPYIVALTLLLNAGFFGLWLRPWQWGENANLAGSHISGGQVQQISRQEATVIPAAPPAQSQVKQEATVIPAAPPAQSQVKQEAAMSQPRREQNSAPNPPASDVRTAVSASPPVSATQTHEVVQNQIGENEIPPKAQEPAQSPKTEQAPADRPPAKSPPTDVARKDEVAVKKPDSSKPPQAAKAAGTKKSVKTANLEAEVKKHAKAIEPRPAAGSGIISDIQPLAELGASSKSAAHREPKWRDLAPQIRDTLPHLSFSMLIYSIKPENRWININGTKRREGEEISAGLKLEEITPDGAILSYQGHRFFKAVIGD